LTGAVLRGVIVEENCQLLAEIHSHSPKRRTATRLRGQVAQQRVDFHGEVPGKEIENLMVGISVGPARNNDDWIRSLRGLVIKAQEDERKRLARELHDGLKQQLAMLTIEPGILVQQPPASTLATIEQLHKLQDRVTGLCDDLHRMTLQLHPASLEQLGLIPALRSHCAEFSRNEGIRVWFQDSASLASISPEVVLCLFRIAQEALRNVARHSHAHSVWVELDQLRTEIRLRIVDDGIGFDCKTVASGKCLGIISMRERVQLLAGTLNIQSGPGKGTCVEVRVPRGETLTKQ
jgi:signal transduction histidine kinase